MTWHIIAVTEILASGFRRVAQKAQPTLTDIVARIRGSPVVHADETGWREDGDNGYVWTFSTPTERYFLRRGRTKAVVDEALGADFAGVLVSDFYAAYHHYDGPQQRCWAHLLRDIHDLRALHPEDEPLARWADAVHDVYAKAKAFPHPSEQQRRRAGLALEQRLLARCRPYLDDPTSARAKLRRHVTKHIKSLPRTGCGELFVFVAEPEVPPDNPPQADRRARPAAGGDQTEDQRRHPLQAGHLHQDDLSVGLRYLANPRHQHPHRMPTTARFPPTLKNCRARSPVDVYLWMRIMKTQNPPSAEFQLWWQGEEGLLLSTECRSRLFMIPPMRRIPLPHEPGGMIPRPCGCIEPGIYYCDQHGLGVGLQLSGTELPSDARLPERGRVPQSISLATVEDDFEYEFVHDGLKVTHVPTDSDYHGSLQPGDVITHVNQRSYQRGMFAPLRRDLIEGKRDDIFVSVRRPGYDREIGFVLVRKRMSINMGTPGSELIACGYCKGDGGAGRGWKCEVCGGIGRVFMKGPIVQCGYCKGNGGAGRGWRCEVCKGVGQVPADAVKRYGN